MNEKKDENNLEALNAGIAESREEIAALAAGLKKLADGDNRNSGWTGFRNRLDDAGARGEEVVQVLADEIKRHPLLGGLAAFGIGFGIATLLFKRSKRDSRL
ncbi:MAG: hypothetical protein PHE84_12765 [bacterium]|nr:hypothetical protein [bacterium]